MGLIKVLRDVSLPSIDPSSKPSIGDVYFLPDGQQRPLLIVMPGAFGDKAWYTGIASELASSGDGVVLVAQQNNDLPTPKYVPLTHNKNLR
jgi:dienelactone hydrolase